MGIFDYLRADVIQKFGKSVESMADAKELSDCIFDKTKVKLSDFTIRRFFGLIRYGSSPSKTTLCAFARYLDYTGWADYEQHCNVDSNFVSVSKILVKDLRAGQTLHLEWLPNRVCDICYLGNGKFEVKSVKYSKLQKGDQFSTPEFVLGAPLTLTNVMRAKEYLGTYIAGQNGGIKTLVLND